MAVTCVVLAAGASTRMGRPKATLELGGETLLGLAVRHCRPFPVVVVAPESLRERVPPIAGFVPNDEPARGMTHSLRLAVATIDPAHAILVLPADLPFVDETLVAQVAHAPAADVAYPLCGARAAHPVRFSANARLALAHLPDGDTLRLLRDDPGLSRVIAGRADPRTQRDIDTEADYAAASPAP